MKKLPLESLLVAALVTLIAPVFSQETQKKVDPINNQGRTQYKLIFPTYHDGVIRNGELSNLGSEFDKARLSVNKSFIEELNKAAHEGYRLKTLVGAFSVSSAFPIAIVERDEGAYEYAWFGTGDSMTAKQGFFYPYLYLTRAGFSLRGHLFTRDCDGADPEKPTFTCTTEFFLLEKKQGVANVKYSSLEFTTSPRWHKDMGVGWTSMIRQRLAKGFYPTHLLSGFELLFEKTEDGREILSRGQDVQVVTGDEGFEKKVQKFAKQGYRLALINGGTAIMYRQPGATPVSYIWLDAKEKNFESQLSRLEAAGAVYGMTYPMADGIEKTLIFEQSAAESKAPRREYRVLKFEIGFTADAVEGKVRRDLTPASEETVKQINALAKEGFRVRDLFISDKVSVILERLRPSP